MASNFCAWRNWRSMARNSVTSSAIISMAPARSGIESMRTWSRTATIPPSRRRHFGFDALYLSMFAARSHERGMLFGEAEDVTQQVESVQFLRSSAAEDGE